MSGGFFKVTIIDGDYHHTTYQAWVNATTSKNQAIAMGAALAGQEKMRREHDRTGGKHDLVPEGLLAPELKLEPCTLDDYYAHEYEVVVTTS